MEFYAGFFVVVQFILVLAAGGLFLMSQQRARIRSASRETHRLMAVFLIVFALLVAVPFMIAGKGLESFDTSLILLLTMMVVTLCGLVIRRSYTAVRQRRSREPY